MLAAGFGNGGLGLIWDLIKTENISHRFLNGFSNKVLDFCASSKSESIESSLSHLSFSQKASNHDLNLISSSESHKQNLIIFFAAIDDQGKVTADTEKCEISSTVIVFMQPTLFASSTRRTTSALKPTDRNKFSGDKTQMECNTKRSSSGGGGQK